MRQLGIEPGSTAWKAAMLTTIPLTLDVNIDWKYILNIARPNTKNEWIMMEVPSWRNIFRKWKDEMQNLIKSSFPFSMHSRLMQIYKFNFENIFNFCVNSAKIYVIGIIIVGDEAFPSYPHATKKVKRTVFSRFLSKPEPNHACTFN